MTAIEDRPETAPEAATDIVEPNWPATERSPVALLSLVTATFFFLVALLIAYIDTGALQGFEQELLRFFEQLPNPVERFLLGISQFIALLYPVVLGVAFIGTKRSRVVLVAAVAAGAAAALVWVIDTLVDRPRPPALDAARIEDTWIIGAGFPDVIYTAIAAALAVVVGAYAGRRWRIVAWSIVGLVVLFRVLSGTEVPVDLALALTVGWAAGAGALLVFGIPSHRSTGQQVAAAMAQTGAPLRELHPAAVDARVDAVVRDDAIG